jgi:hypothetical protein
MTKGGSMNSIQGIDGMSGIMGMGGMHPPSELTDEQKQTIQNILSKYDPENIDAETAQEIFDKFREAGITPARGMKEAIEAAGFDAEELRSLAQPQGNMPPPPPTEGKSKIDVSALQSLMDILNQYDLENLSSEDEETLMQQLQSAGFLQSGSILNTSA